MVIKTCLLLVAAIPCAIADPQEGPPCKVFLPEAGAAATNYVRKLAKLPTEAKLDLTRSALEGGTCYRRLEFAVGGQATKIILYLSPDQRFLSTRLFDSHVDPADAEAAEAAKISAQINSHLSAHNHPILGAQNAPVTIAVFSDFQCPFCKRAMEILTKEVLPTSDGQVRIAYVHYPLTTHSWARQAAESMACLHNPAAFWATQAFLFEHQAEITPGNVASEVGRNLSSQSEQDIDLAQFKSCIGSKDAALQIDDDVALGQELNVSVTPTLFVNGQRLAGLKSASEIDRLIGGRDRTAK